MFSAIVASLITIAVWEYLRRLADKSKYPHALSCVHCKNRGENFEIKATDPTLLGQVMDKHKRDVHPYAA